MSSISSRVRSAPAPVPPAISFLSRFWRISRLGAPLVYLSLSPNIAGAAPNFDDKPVEYTPVTNFGSAFDRIVSQTDPTKTKLDNGYSISDLTYVAQKTNDPTINVNLRWISSRLFNLDKASTLNFTITGDTNVVFGSGQLTFEVFATLDGGTVTKFTSNLTPLGRSLTWDMSQLRNVTAGDHRLGMFSNVTWKNASVPDMVDVSSLYKITVAVVPEPSSYLFFTAGLAVLLGYGRRQRKKTS